MHFRRVDLPITQINTGPRRNHYVVVTGAYWHNGQYRLRLANGTDVSWATFASQWSLSGFGDDFERALLFDVMGERGLAPDGDGDGILDADDNCATVQNCETGQTTGCAIFSGGLTKFTGTTRCGSACGWDLRTCSISRLPIGG